jgi:hypothetical protein
MDPFTSQARAGVFRTVDADDAEAAEGGDRRTGTADAERLMTGDMLSESVAGNPLLAVYIGGTVMSATMSACLPNACPELTRAALDEAITSGQPGGGCGTQRAG